MLIATGSEVQLCLKAHDALAKEGIKVRVVSMPSWELFDAQDAAYRDTVLPPDIIAARLRRSRLTPRLGALCRGDGARIGMDSFGASAPADDVYRKFGITADAVDASCAQQIAREGPA